MCIFKNACTRYIKIYMPEEVAFCPYKNGRHCRTSRFNGHIEVLFVLFLRPLIEFMSLHSLLVGDSES